MGESNQKQGLAVGITLFTSSLCSRLNLSAGSLICEMKEIETNLPPRVSTQCNALKKMVCMEQMEQSEDILQGLTSVRWSN